MRVGCKNKARSSISGALCTTCIVESVFPQEQLVFKDGPNKPPTGVRIGTKLYKATHNSLKNSLTNVHVRTAIIDAYQDNEEVANKVVKGLETMREKSKKAGYLRTARKKGDRKCSQLCAYV